MDSRDQRQPPPPNLPFSRNTQSPLYTRQPLPPPTPSSSSTTPVQTYSAHQQQQQQQQPPSSGSSAYPPDNASRRPSDPPHFYSSSRTYEPNAPIPPSSHSRHPSASITPGPSLNRPMPPPASPPQPGSGPGPGQGLPVAGGASYGLPPPRPPPVSVGPSTAFPGGRELPALGSLSRTGTGGSSMSISSMLGGPSQSRDPAAAPYAAAPSSSAGPSAPTYPSSTHASPRMNPSPVEYAPYRRPHTPEHARMYEPRDARNSAASPHAMHMTPEMQRYGTPQAFRPPPQSMGPADHARDFQRPSGGPAPPPRPNSQPKAYPPPSRPMEMGRPPPPEMYARREEVGPGMEYNPERPVVLKYEEPRFLSERERYERDVRERERERDREREFRERERIRDRDFELRERDHRERTMSGSDPGRSSTMHPPDYGPPAISKRDAPGPQQYARSADPREQAEWHRPPYEQGRAPFEEPRPPPRQSEFPRASAQPYNHPTASYPQPPHERYPPASHPAHAQPGPQSSHPIAAFESPDRHRAAALLPPQQQQQPPPRRPGDDGPPPPSVAYSNGHAALYDSPRHRPVEEPPHPMAPQQHFLRIQEINRKGRISPLPQAVQGAQPQIQGPPGEAGIKSEFGRMFSGIGNGVSGLSMPSPVAAGAHLPPPSNALGRRDEMDHMPPDAINEAKTGREAAPRAKRRKAKDDDAKGDEDSNGRNTPLGNRAKRLKTHSHHHHHHQYVLPPLTCQPHEAHSLSHHHHHHHIPEQVSPQQAGPSPFKSVKGALTIPSPTTLAKDLLITHHHAAPRSVVAYGQVRDQSTRPAVAPLPSPVVVIPPKPKRIVSNKAVLDSIAHRPKGHLGDFVYELKFQPARIQDPRTGRPPRHAYASTPTPLPMDVIKGKEGSTLMVRVGKQHLTASSREEITSRRAVWGTDVYTDDSDVVAACIHAGWIRGEWPEDVDVDLLGLDEGVDSDAKSDKEPKGGKKGRSKEAAEPKRDPDFLDAPPKTGPVAVPAERDMHVTVVILPKLEKYASTVRFGIKSRAWGGKLGRDGQRSSHDGLSFMIQSVRFVTNGAGAQARLRGKARRERLWKAMQEVDNAFKNCAPREPAKIMTAVVSLAPKKKGLASEGDKEHRSHGSDSPRTDAGRAKATNEAGSASSGEHTDQNEQHGRDDDSGVGDVGDAAAAATAAAPNVPAPIAMAVTTIDRRLTPPEDA